MATLAISLVLAGVGFSGMAVNQMDGQPVLFRKSTLIFAAGVLGTVACFAGQSSGQDPKWIATWLGSVGIALGTMTYHLWS